MSFLKQILIGLSGHQIVQTLLQKNVAVSQFLMGIGAGTGVDDSGEEGVFRFVKEKLQGPFCVFDVGANQGQYLNLTSRQLQGRDVEIHCFEPSAHTFGLLQANAPQRDGHQIQLNHLALGAAPDELTLYSNQPGSGLASLTKRRLDHFSIPFQAQETVKVETLDRYCEMNHINSISLLKLDVEGHELQVLEGAQTMLSKGAIQCMTFEFGGCNIDTKTFFQDFFYLCQKYGMKLSRMTPSGFLVPLPTYSEVYEQFRTTNYFAHKQTL